WEEAQLDGARVGSVHTSVRTAPPAKGAAAGGRILRATQTFELTFRRGKALVQVRMEHGTDETPEGRVLGVFMKQFHGSGQWLMLTCTVQDGRLHYVVDQGRIDRRVWWSEAVVGVYGQQQLLRGKKLKPGDTLTFFSYEPTIAAVVTRRVRAIGLEDVTFAAGPRKLLRVEDT